MNILFAAPKQSWGEIFEAIRTALPEHQLEITDTLECTDLKKYEVLIPTVVPVTRELLEGCSQLRLIQQCGSGLDSVDLQSANETGIWVANVPTWVSGTADSIAEMGIHMMIGISRNIRDLSRNFVGRRMGGPVGRALSGSTAGIIGMGGIGRALVKRLKCFDIRMIGIRRRVERENHEELGLEWVGTPAELHRLLGETDYVFLCLPLMPETSGMINRDSISMMKPGAFIINLSRGGIVDREALHEALESGSIAGAGLDVFWEEPPDPNDAIFGYNVIATPHSAALTDASVRGVARVVAENVRRIENGEIPRFWVVKGR
ncbi:MAG: NAD(P)-dependent oxidoreductase [Syntrophobacteraceae bacterium]